MTEQETREKIVSVLFHELKNRNASCNEDGACDKCWFPCIVQDDAERIADALIKAGIGDVDEWKHRAEDLQKKVDRYRKKIKYGKLVEPIWFNSWLNGLPCYGRVIGYNKDDGFVIECIDSMISAKKIYMTEKEAEEASAEEGKDD